MYTQCPECLTIFQLDATDVTGAHGTARCGHCAATFDTLVTLTAGLPPEPIDRLAQHQPLPDPPQLGSPVYRPHPDQGALFADPGERKPSGHAGPSPAFARRRRRERHQRNWPWLAASTLLLLTLGIQIAWGQRAQWLDNNSVRPWLDHICARIGCHLPLRHDIAALKLLSRDIRPHPSVANALIISATLRNEAAFTQAFPIIDITLSDLDDNRVAMRRFRPREYIDDPRLIDAGLRPGATAALIFEVADPGHNAVAFAFDFE